MGQQLSAEALSQSVENELSLPSWLVASVVILRCRYNADFVITHTTISICRSSINLILSGDCAVFKRVQSYRLYFTDYL